MIIDNFEQGIRYAFVSFFNIDKIAIFASLYLIFADLSRRKKCVFRIE